jgi:hypothetical protein
MFPTQQPSLRAAQPRLFNPLMQPSHTHSGFPQQQLLSMPHELMFQGYSHAHPPAWNNYQVPPLNAWAPGTISSSIESDPVDVSFLGELVCSS